MAAVRAGLTGACVASSLLLLALTGCSGEQQGRQVSVAEKDLAGKWSNGAGASVVLQADGTFVMSNVPDRIIFGSISDSNRSGSGAWRLSNRPHATMISLAGAKGADGSPSQFSSEMAVDCLNGNTQLFFFNQDQANAENNFERADGRAPCSLGKS